MRIVADTHILFSGFSNPNGYSGIIMNAWKQGLFDVAISESILHELQRVSYYPYAIKTLRWTEQTRKRFFDTISYGMIKVIPVLHPRVVSADVDDDMWFACAKAAQAQYVVTKDKLMLAVKNFDGIQVVKPGYFVNQVLSVLKPI